MVIDFQKSLPQAREVTTIKGQIVECAETYKYLGMIIHSKLFEANCDNVYKKVNQRLFCLRKLSSFHIDRTLMTLFYHAFIKSIQSFCIVLWFGNLSLKNRNRLIQIVKWSSKLIGIPLLNPESLYSKQLQRIAGTILKDHFHPLYGDFQLLLSGRRYKSTSL